RHHYAVGKRDDVVDVTEGFGLFYLGDDRSLRLVSLEYIAHCLDVGCFSDKRQGDPVDIMLHSEFQVYEILFRKGRCGNLCEGKVDPFSRLKRSTMYDLRDNFFLPHFGDLQFDRSEEHTSELQSRENLVCRLLLDKKK